MKRLLLLIPLLIISLIALCQIKNYDNLISRLKLQYKNNAATPKPKNIFINKFNKIIDIEGLQVSLDSVKVFYFFNNASKSAYQNQVKFDCIAGNCIIYNIKNEKVSGLKIAFKTKQACYDFINTLSEIKKLMDKN